MTEWINSGPPPVPADSQRPSFRGVGEVASAIKWLPNGNPLAGRQWGYSYDLDGNMLSDGHWLCAWDAEPRRLAGAKVDGQGPPAGRDERGARASHYRLVSLVTASGLDAAIPKRRVDMAYDSMGRRISRTASHWDSVEDYTDAGERADPANWTADEDWKYLYDGWNVVARLDAADSDSLDQAYVWGLDLSGTMQGAGGVGGLLLVRDADDADDHAPCYDGNGNVVALYLVAGGTPGLTAEYEYDAFGNTLRATGAYAGENGWRFSTKDEDGVTGLVYYGFRYYAPHFGRWLSRNPIGEEGGLNMYQLLLNNGVSRTDYLRLKTAGEGEILDATKQGCVKSISLESELVDHDLGKKNRSLHHRVVFKLELTDGSTKADCEIKQEMWGRDRTGGSGTFRPIGAGHPVPGSLLKPESLGAIYGRPGTRPGKPPKPRPTPPYGDESVPDHGQLISGYPTGIWWNGSAWHSGFTLKKWRSDTSAEWEDKPGFKLRKGESNPAERRGYGEDLYFRWITTVVDKSSRTKVARIDWGQYLRVNDYNYGSISAFGV